MKRKIVFLTGAGISQESGIPTFRDSIDGLWENNKVEDVATVSGVFSDINRSETFFNSLKQKISECSPNAAHIAIADLAKDSENFEVIVLTQNVDDLHRRSGTPVEKTIELHGNIFRNRCRSHPDISGTDFKEARGCSYTGAHYDENWKFPQACPRCHKPATFSPDVVLFGEALDFSALSDAEYHASTADLFIQIGTSMEVFPVAALIESVPISKRAYIDIEKPEKNGIYEYEFIGKAAEITPKVCNMIKEQKL